ncbi:MAG: LacI family DNA-binding transcriptional regulator [Xanthomonadaceae bacterium]|nr:LacI family DNA-binding transcriptional regulator [Xanthomonadaceae bacterium]MDP2186466.1 LacI family DNA-binding transcriptional regulator [Xanthomonadales bacterium]MDZ4117386.1 LacI family DNA-binding transcriptional regulator [Xanthomonadaceae bacterium]MDZ4379590.1 LacI family DNA-binding transcriptional regulator [Xanthomonadaceae bacterium]
MSITIKEVALAAGVSVATVSRAMNGHANVTPATSARILEVMRELRYTPHGAAQSLVTRRTQTIGVLLPDMHGEFFSELIRGIDAAARIQGLHLLLSSSHGDLSDTTAALKMMRGRVDGLLIMSPTATAQFYAEQLHESLPAVLINAPAGAAPHACVAVDNYGGAVQMVRHLHRSGRKRIAFVSGPNNNHDAVERLRGFREALSALEPDYQPLVMHGDFNEPSGFRAGQQVVALAERPDAVFAANDMMAIGCLLALAEAGVRVPEDVAVVGYDNIPTARFVRPALTTVSVPIADLGTVALERLVSVIEDPAKVQGQETLLRTQLVVRGSCGASRVSNSNLRVLGSGGRPA